MEIYRILNLITGKSYIGKTSIGYLNRFKKHLNNASKNINRYLYDSMNKYGSEFFIIGILEDCISVEELNLKESYYIKKYNSLYPNGYNMTIGGDGGNTLLKWSEEKKKELYKKQAESRFGKTRTEEQRKNMSLAQKGKVISQKTKNLISEKLKINYQNKTEKEKRKATEHLIYSYGNRKGSKHTEASKLKMSESASKSWNEKYTKIQITERKQSLSSRMKNNNPNKVEITSFQIKQIHNFIDTKEKVEIFAEKIGLSPFKIRQVIKALGISNLQHYRQKVKNEKTSNNPKD